MKKIDKFILNTKPIFLKTATIFLGILSIFGILIPFLSTKFLDKISFSIKVIILVSLLLVIFIIVTLFYMFILKKKLVWTRGKNTVYAMYGDLLKIGFNLTKATKNIVVIPVNTSFDTIVEEVGEHNPYPLVSVETIHGKWINKFLDKENITQKELNDRINKSLERYNYKPIEITNKENGNLEVFKTGTIATIDGSNNTVYFLLAISNFDGTNKAQSNRKIVTDAFDELLEFYDTHGQGNPLYVPLLGTGRSRTGITHVRSFKMLKSSILRSEEQINGQINIVIHNKEKHKISIFDYWKENNKK